MPQINTTYDRKMQELREQELRQQIYANVEKHKKVIPTYPKDLVSMMSLVEDTLVACRGEKTADFREVTRDSIRIHTRLPLKNSLIPGVTPSANDKKASRIIMECLMLHPMIKGVRCIPDENDIGSYVIVSLQECK